MCRGREGGRVGERGRRKGGAKRVVNSSPLLGPNLAVPYNFTWQVKHTSCSSFHSEPLENHRRRDEPTQLFPWCTSTRETLRCWSGRRCTRSVARLMLVNALVSLFTSLLSPQRSTLPASPSNNTKVIGEHRRRVIVPVDGPKNEPSSILGAHPRPHPLIRAQRPTPSPKTRPRRPP